MCKQGHVFFSQLFFFLSTHPPFHRGVFEKTAELAWKCMPRGNSRFSSCVGLSSLTDERKGVGVRAPDATQSKDLMLYIRGRVRRELQVRALSRCHGTALFLFWSLSAPPVCCVLTPLSNPRGAQRGAIAFQNWPDLPFAEPRRGKHPWRGETGTSWLWIAAVSASFLCDYGTRLLLVRSNPPFFLGITARRERKSGVLQCFYLSPPSAVWYIRDSSFWGTE